MSLKKDEAGNLTDVPLFKLYLQTKLPNPHYIPELQAQTTLINFTVTERGLEAQLLAVVVNKERPDLEELVEQHISERNKQIAASNEEVLKARLASMTTARTGGGLRFA